MKTVFLVVSICVAFLTVKSQSNEKRCEISGFGTPLFQLNMVNESPSVIIGGGGAILINNKFFIGGFGEGFGIENAINDYVNYSLQVGHGGPWLGYIYSIKEKSSIEFSTQLGWGSAFFINDGEVSYFDNYFVGKPILEYNRKLSSIFKLGVGGSWSFYNGIDNPSYSDTDLSKPSLFITLKFGWFE